MLHFKIYKNFLLEFQLFLTNEFINLKSYKFNFSKSFSLDFLLINQSQLSQFHII